MEKISQLICFIGLVLAMTICITEAGMNRRELKYLSKQLAKKLQNTDCVTTTIRNHACHGDKCHDAQTYIHGCDTYSDDKCDNLTVHYDAHNSTGWRNTTCQLYACYEEVSDDCGNANLTFKSCTDDDCRSGTTQIHGCFSPSETMYSFDRASIFSGLNVEDIIGDFFDTPCINLLFYTYRGARLDSGK